VGDNGGGGGWGKMKGEDRGWGRLEGGGELRVWVTPSGRPTEQ